MSDADSGRDRRGFLAGVGAVGLGALAGCSALDPIDGDDTEPTVETAPFDDFGGDLPTIPTPLPVAVASDYLDRAAASARADLDAVPHPLTGDDVPNGAVRDALAERYADATDALDRAGSASTDAGTLDALRDARRAAAAARAGWRAVDGSLTRADVRERAPPVADDVRAFRERWRYVGSPEDAVRALLVHAELEDLVANARTSIRSLRSPRSFVDPAPDGPPAVADEAAALESARVAVADAAYLYDRFVASLDATRSYAGTFDAAEATLANAVAERASDVSDADHGSDLVDADIDAIAVRSALDDILFDVQSDASYYREMDRVAGAIREHHGRLAGLRALDALVAAVESGDYATVENAEDVVAIRSDAVTALTGARGGRHPRLNALGLRWLPETIRRSDDELASYDDPVPVTYLVRDVGRYVRVAYVAAAVPGASERVVGALSA
ncbi:hypothetical protein GCM10009037_22550 [Halarchaeum grantii]|uniref:Tat (Twin-arginine translocation) pathway signal sequence n=1 Tax=Halarchaeum grantii TaxID=1193105 RepID=A0A830EWS7_9EURY|nr:hypothetical protein [Halarchaeum grantii]GGL38410.1 hypothetical protein GCM10009037_22550 [Halarchaeum grantii]